MKDKSIKSTMKSWIMLSDKELDDTQVYMKEQEGEEYTVESEDGSGGSGTDCLSVHIKTEYRRA